MEISATQDSWYAIPNRVETHRLRTAGLNKHPLPYYTGDVFSEVMMMLSKKVADIL